MPETSPGSRGYFAYRTSSCQLYILYIRIATIVYTFSACTTCRPLAVRHPQEVCSPNTVILTILRSPQGMSCPDLSGLTAQNRVHCLCNVCDYDRCLAYPARRSTGEGPQACLAPRESSCVTCDGRLGELPLWRHVFGSYQRCRTTPVCWGAGRQVQGCERVRPQARAAAFNCTSTQHSKH